MAKYLTNTILKFNTITIGETVVNDYSSLDFVGIKRFVNSSPAIWFDWYKLENNDNLERVSLDIYSTADYWDILLVINGMNPLYDIPVDFDTVIGNVDYLVNEYETRVYKNNLLPGVRQTLADSLFKVASGKVESDRVIRIVKPGYVHDFLKAGTAAGVFNA